MQEKTNIKFIHYLRAIGALSVVYSHWGMMFFLSPDACSNLSLYVDFPRACIPFLIQATSFNIFNYGNFGVALFFLISGFLTPVSWSNRTIGEFIAKRAWRLYPLYTIGLLFTGGVLYGSAKLNGLQFPYTVDIFLKNLSLLRPWFWVPTIDGINWTMEVDVMFYLVCIMFTYFGVSVMNERAWVAVSLIISMSVYLTEGMSFDWMATRFHVFKFFFCVNHFAAFFPMMFIGMSLWKYMNHLWKPITTAVYVLFFYASFCFIFSITDIGNCYRHWFSYGCAVSLFVVFCWGRKRIESFSCKPLEYIGAISFPLYLVHGAAGYAVLAWLYKHGFGFWSFIIAGIGFLGLATVLHICVEKKLHFFAKQWTQRISGLSRG